MIRLPAVLYSSHRQQCRFVSLLAGCAVSKGGLFNSIDLGRNECMKKAHILVILACTIVLGPGRAMCQSHDGMSLPKVLWIFREDVKPSRASAHERVEQGFAQIWTKIHAQPYLSVDAVSGNANEVMFLSGYGSLASFEKDFQTFANASNGPMKAELEALAKQEAELVNAVRSTVALYRPDLSYLGDRFMGGLPKARYFEIATFRVRPGKDDSFAEGTKMYQTAYEKLNYERPFATYQVMSGAPAGTYLVFVPLNSLKDLDDSLAMRGKLMEAMGEENFKNMMKGAGEVFSSTESNIYAFNPKTSHVSKEFAAGDAEFWTPKSKAVTQPAQKAAKPGN